ncbi:hypothetical protein [Pedobacter immunditicola]|uniref:hypothetical protein n=1 Tax=Pedobacter immunditicola TaxID=3133440 RepID=UPI0030A81537
MNKFLSKVGVIFFFCSCLGCSSSKNKPVHIEFSADSNAIVLSDINPVGLLQLTNNDFSDSTKMNWVSVSMEGKEVPGKVNIQEDKILFVPEKPFQRGKSYLVSTPLNVTFGGAKEILKGKVSYQLKPQQKTLQR